MNPVLRNEIVKHIFTNFGIISSDYVNNDKTQSLISQEYLLPEKLTFEDDNGTVYNNKVWGCQLSVGSQEIKVLLADCLQEKDVPEFCLLIQLKDAPAYGVYLNINEYQINTSCMIAYLIDSKSWLECSTFLQATFLSGMEQIRETGFAWSKIKNYQSQYQSLISFIQYYSSIYEVEYEGQES